MKEMGLPRNSVEFDCPCCGASGESLEFPVACGLCGSDIHITQSKDELLELERTHKNTHRGKLSFLPWYVVGICKKNCKNK